MSILPTFITETPPAALAAVLPVPVEYGMDFKTCELTGKKVTGLEAVKVWAYNALRAERYRWPIYSRQYGTSLEQYIGSYHSAEYIMDDCRKEVEESMKTNPYIRGISDFSAELAGDHLSISFVLITIYGKTEVDMDV